MGTHDDDDHDERPLAPAATERLAHDIFPVGAMSPGEYAARHGSAEHGCFGYARYRYRDARLDRWLQAVATILGSPSLLARVRARVRVAEDDDG